MVEASSTYMPLKNQAMSMAPARVQKIEGKKSVSFKNRIEKVAKEITCPAGPVQSVPELVEQ